MKILGFTGTSEGMSDDQIRTTENLILNLDFDQFHHGDCVGADEQADEIVWTLGKRSSLRVIHPPNNPTKRAYCDKKRSQSVIVLPEKEYLRRNHDIVNACELLIATPKEYHEVQRSGTWATIRYALKIKKPVLIIWRAGDIKRIG